MTQRTLQQFFHWYTPAGAKLWNEVAEKAELIASMSITGVWLPPAYKSAARSTSVGYDTYDLFDLGEFDQKGSVATKYGDRASFENECTALQGNGVRAIHDGADAKETVKVRRVNGDDGTQIEDNEFEALAYTRFTCPGREGQHSKFVWDKQCFGGADIVEQPDKSGIFILVNEYGEGQWNEQVHDEFRQFDHLMAADVEFRNNAVYEELKNWGRWLDQQVPMVGFHLDAAKHILAWFFRDRVAHMRDTTRHDCLPKVEARSRFAHGPQTDCLDHPSCVASVRHGTADMPGCVVVMSNGEAGEKSVDLGADLTGVAFRDYLRYRDDEIVVEAVGTASFPVHGGSVSVWVRADAL